MASESSNTVESSTNLVFLNKILLDKTDLVKLNNDILFVLTAINPEFSPMWKYSSSTLKLRTEFIREFMKSLSRIEIEFTEEITGISTSLNLEQSFNSLFTSLPNNVHCLLMKYRLVNEFYLILLFLLANKHIMNYEIFEKICFNYGHYNNSKTVFYIQNRSNIEDIKGNVLQIDLQSVRDKLESMSRENSERFGLQIIKYIIIGLLCLVGGFYVFKFIH